MLAAAAVAAVVVVEVVVQQLLPLLLLCAAAAAAAAAAVLHFLLLLLLLLLGAFVYCCLTGGWLWLCHAGVHGPEFGEELLVFFHFHRRQGRRCCTSERRFCAAFDHSGGSRQ